MPEVMSQQAQVLALLRDRGERGLTSLEALREVGTMRLAHHIHVLRNEGYDIRTHDEKNGRTRYARYVLREEPTLWLVPRYEDIFDD